MFGIGKVLQNVLEQHNLGHALGQLDTETMAGLRHSLEAVAGAADIGDIGRLLDDVSAQLQDKLGEAAEEAGHLADNEEPEGLGGILSGLGAAAHAASDAVAAQAQPAEAEPVPHEAVHTLQGVAVEDDGVIATEAEAPVAATPADIVQVHEADETADD